MNDYFLHCYSAQLTESFSSTRSEDITCPLDQDFIDYLCPINLETGLRESPLVRVNDPSISDSERQALLSTLPRFDSPKGLDVDDDTKLMFVKLRSLQTPSELSAFRDSIQNWLDSQSSGETSGESSGESSDESSGESSDESSGESSGV